MVTGSVRGRLLERHSAASLRAIAGEPRAELRAQRLRVAGRSVAMASPHLVADMESVTVGRARGVADALGLLVRYSDHDLHRQMAPEAPIERVVFDLLEQLRCEALQPDGLAGVQRNLDTAFEGWSLDAQHERIGESGVGLLVFTITQMARARLGRPINDPHVDDLIETTRGTLAPLVGEALYELPGVIGSQRAFAFHARAIAEAVALVAGDSALAPSVVRELEHHQVVLAGWDLDESDDWLHGSPDAPAGRFAEAIDGSVALDALGDYHVFTREFDQVLEGADVAPLRRRIKLREELDRRRAAQAISAPRLAQRLRRLLARPDFDDWTFGEEDGLLDGARLSQLVADPTNHRVFRRSRVQPTAQVCVTFLVDTSGSMKLQRFEAVAVLVDTFAQALDLAGVSSEVLGFTTGGWNGGRAMRHWRRAGAPDRPGRLNEVQHIVYKGADLSWRRSRRSMAAMLSTNHYRESVDGEALIWAYERLSRRPEPRRLLVVVSDGTPMDSATANNNRSGFLDDHLHATVRAIEQSGEVEIGAIGLDDDVSSVFERSVGLDLSGVLNTRTYEVLADLFA